SGTVHRARPFAEAVVALARLAREMMVDAVVPPAEIIGLRRPVLGHQGLAIGAALVPAAMEAGEVYGVADLCGLDDERLRPLDQAEAPTGEALEAHPVAARFVDILGAGCDRPAWRAVDIAVGEQQQADDIVFED